MKMKNLTSFLLSGLLLILFMPVFYCVLFIGNDMNYNVKHKITTLFPNTTLLLYGFLALGLFVVLWLLLSKIPVNRYTVGGTILFSIILCIIFYIVKTEVSKCIAFYGGWDCGAVANSARWIHEGKDLGYDDYYYIYSNNVPITWLLYVLYRFADSLTGYPYNPEFIWIQFQCVMFALATFFSAMTALIVTGKIAHTILTLLTSTLLLGLCPWQSIPYTDAGSIAMPVLVMFLYALSRHIKPKSRYLIWFVLVFTGMIGGILKATCYIALIAVVGIDFLWLLFDKETVSRKIKNMAFRIFIMGCGMIAALWCKAGMYDTLHYVPDQDLQITWTNYFYNGLNETTTGACSGDGLSIVRSYAGYPRSFRESVELHYAKDRILEKGIGGLLGFWLRKQVMNFNDGTFSWFQEGYFHAWDYEELTDNTLKEPLRDFYWKDRADYLKFTTWSQGAWLFLLMGILFEAAWLMGSVIHTRNNTETRCIHTVEITTFIGIFLFVMLFEGRARYLLNYVPVFILIAISGYSNVIQAAFSHLTGRFYAIP